MAPATAATHAIYVFIKEQHNGASLFEVYYLGATWKKELVKEIPLLQDCSEEFEGRDDEQHVSQYHGGYCWTIHNPCQ